jgi:hypothetical protein
MGGVKAPPSFNMRCFVIGNGTSLTPDQLDMVHEAKIPSFACNRINLIYPQTKWRPDVYVHPESLAPDMPYILENVEMGITCYLGEHYAKPPRGVMDLDDERTPNIHFIKDCHHHTCNFDSPEIPDEWHLPQLCSFGGSVNVAMQVAVMNGFDEIVLLGCDLEYKNGKGKCHMHKDYEHGGEQPPFYASRNAFYGHVQALNWIHRRKKSILVLNATNGGLLELWPRVRLRDVLF